MCIIVTASLRSANSSIDLTTDVQHLHRSLILSGAKRTGRHIDERSCSKIRHPCAVFANARRTVGAMALTTSLTSGPSSLASVHESTTATSRAIATTKQHNWLLAKGTVT